MPNSPFRYINFRGQQPYVRPSGGGRWIKYKDWYLMPESQVQSDDLQRDITQFELEEEGSFLFCPNCGIKWEKEADFCPRCGKDLRDLIIN